jgi:hypothetical protein
MTKARGKMWKTLSSKRKRIKESRLRRTATSTLGYIARYRENKTKILNQLRELLRDESFYVRNTACKHIRRN